MIYDGFRSKKLFQKMPNPNLVILEHTNNIFLYNINDIKYKKFKSSYEQQPLHPKFQPHY